MRKYSRVGPSKFVTLRKDMCGPDHASPRSGKYLWLASALLLAGCVQSQSANTTSSASPVGPNTLNVADAAIAGGDPNMALSVSQSVLSTDAGNVDALEHEGDAYYALGRCPAAEAAYQLALTHDPKATAAETGLGRCLLKTDPRAAEAAFEAAVQDDPGNAAALNDLGISRDLQGNFAAAVQPYQQALLADPSLTAAEVNLGLSLALSGNGPAALQYLGPLATGQTATPKIREDYAAALLASGRASEAKQVLSVDLPPDQVVSALEGFSDVIANSQGSLAAVPPPAPTITEVQTTQVSVASIPQATSPVPLTPPPAVAPAATAYVPDNSTAAYTGPSPVPVTASSSTRGPVATPPPADVTSATPPPVRVIAKPRAPKPAPAAAITPPTTVTTNATGNASVQLGALNSSDEAQRAWRNISGAVPALFTGKQPDIIPVTINGKTYYRLRVGGFDNRADAAKFCGEVSAAGNACTLANF